MNFFVNLASNSIVQGVSNNSPVANINLKFGDSRNDLLVFCNGGVAVDIGTPRITLGIKLPGASTYVVSALPEAVIKNGVGSAASWTITTNLYTAALGAALGIGTNAEKEFVTAELAIQYTYGTATIETATVPVTIYRRINAGNEGILAAANYTYPAPDALEVIAKKGVAGGYAPLGDDGKLPSSFLSVAWNVLTGIPAWISGATAFGQSLATAATAASAKTLLALVKGDVGLGNVDNTSDANKPVSNAQASADASVKSYAIARGNHTGTQLASTISDFGAGVLASLLSGLSTASAAVIATTDTVLGAFGKLQAQITALNSSKVSTSTLGAAGGVATLDGGGKVPAAQLPASLMNYLGAWDASTNTPALANGTGVAGSVYNVTVAGTALGLNWGLGDWAIYNGTIWEKSANADDIISVNGMTGAVVLNTDNIPEGTSNKYFTAARAQAALASTVATLAPLASPALTGSPTAPTPTGGDSSTKIATTSFVQSAIAGITNALGAIVSGVSSVAGKTGDVTLSTDDVAEGSELYFTADRAQAALAGTVATLAPLNSPALTGTPTVPVPNQDDNTTRIANTAWVRVWVANFVNGVMSGITVSSSDILNTALTGLSTASTAVITATDTILSALGKLQAQLGLKAGSAVTQVFTSNGTWTKPAGAKTVVVTCIGGGGGGGGASVSVTGGNRVGAGGGAGGTCVTQLFPADFLSASHNVIVGTGGNGGLGNSSTTANNGSVGGFSLFGNLVIANGGGGGQAGTTTQQLLGITYGVRGAGSGGGVGSSVGLNPCVGGPGYPFSQSNFSINGSNTPNFSYTGGGGGGAGGGFYGAATAAGMGGLGPSGTGTSAAGTGDGGAGANGASLGSNSPIPGAGGGGGATSTTGNGGNGGAGGFPAGGGGGGGTGVTTGGNGGKGADGIVFVTTYF